MTNQDHIDAMLAKLRERIPGLAGIRRQRRERSDAKLREAAYGDAADAQMDADLLKQVGCDCFECWALRTTMAWFLEDEYDDGLPYDVDSVTFDDDGAHIDGCDLPRCPVCAETMDGYRR